MSECARCGRPLGGEHCVYCGRLGTQEPTQRSERPPFAPPKAAPTVRGGPATRSSGSGVTLVHVLIVVAVVGLAAVFLWPSSPDTSDDGGRRPASDAGRASQAGPGTIQSRLDDLGLGRNPIERARLATVQLRVGIASGTAFLFDDDCHAFTNRHVVDPLAFDGAQGVEEALSIAQREARRRRALIDAKRRELERRCPSCSYLDIDDAVAEAERQLEELEEEIRKVRGGIAGCRNRWATTAPQVRRCRDR